jgi:UDP-N-acetylglucosamine 2-epimerase (non-hydrolysing)
MLITIIAGARPNFMKIAPIIHAIEIAKSKGKNIDFRLVHTGQHYDKKMSDDFFEQLNIPQPHVNLAAGGGTQAVQTAAIMISFEQELIKNPTDLVLVVGDVTSTMACSIVAKKLNIKVAHVEAGIRSFDLAMPEEINRMVTDSITDYFFTTSEVANENLRLSGISDKQIFFVGNTMIDTLIKQMSRFSKPDFWDKLQLESKQYIVVTLHRPSNVDDPSQLKDLLEVLENINNNIPVIFPVHPRTTNNLNKFGIVLKHVKTVEPLAYLQFNYLVQHAKGVITDSGGITEETTVMGIPCLTLRNSTERPETCTIGTNVLIGTDPSMLGKKLKDLMIGNWKKGGIPPLWDGKAAERIIQNLITIFNL